MKIKFIFSLFTTALFSFIAVTAQEIPIEYLAMKLQPNKQEYSKTILENEIGGIKVNHNTLTGGVVREEQLEKGYKFIYLFIKGNGHIIANKEKFDIVPETILLPNSVQRLSINATKNDTLHFLKISSKLTEQDMLDLKVFPKEHTQKIYFANFFNSESNSRNRKVLPTKYIPRMAMGIVDAPGPHKVNPHEHPMLDQLFLGLKDNHVLVSADDANIDFPAYSILHIPLGSNHFAEAVQGEKMYYMWMDFFLDKKGEAWLETDKPMKKK